MGKHRTRSIQGEKSRQQPARVGRYSTQIKRQTGVDRKVALSIDTGKKLLSKGKGAVRAAAWVGRFSTCSFLRFVVVSVRFRMFFEVFQPLLFGGKNNQRKY